MKQETDWKHHQKRFKQSGLSVAAYCKKHGLNAATARRHLKVGLPPQAIKIPPKEKGRSRRKRIDWSALKLEFLEGSFVTLRDFAKLKGIDPNSGNFLKSTKTWLQEKANLRQVSEHKAVSQLETGLIETIKEQLQEEAHYCLNKLEELRRHDVEIDTAKSLESAHRSIEIRIRSLKEIKGFLKELNPLHLQGKFNLEEELKRLYGHELAYGNVPSALQVLRTLSQLEMVEGFNWQLFAAWADEEWEIKGRDE